jgi:sodium transport system permease protein
VLSQSLIVAHKELLDHARDVRSVASAALYALMGPAVVLIVLIARTQKDSAASTGQPWSTMAAVFALMTAFTGAMAVATDLIAGERERRSLLPLLVTSCSRVDLVAGKWLAASIFALGGLFVSALAFGLVFAFGAMPSSPSSSILLMAPAFVALAMLAAAVEILISTTCRNVKEANTYLSMLVFGTMGVAMWLAFRSDAAQGWWLVMPLVGQQRLLELGFSAGSSSSWQTALVAIQSVLLTFTTAVLTVLVLAATWSVFRRDEAVYGS